MAIILDTDVIIRGEKGTFDLRGWLTLHATEEIEIAAIREVLAHQLDRFTQSYRITTATEDIIREEPLRYLRADATVETVSLPGATAILGYMRMAQVDTFLAGRCFYCRATDETGHPLSLDLSTAQGAVLIGWSGPLTGPFVTVGWMARVISCRLVSRETVIQETGLEPSSGVIHYVLFKLADVSKLSPRDVSSLVLAANSAGDGGKFRTFESRFSEVCCQNLARWRLTGARGHRSGGAFREAREGDERQSTRLAGGSWEEGPDAG